MTLFIILHYILIFCIVTKFVQEGYRKQKTVINKFYQKKLNYSYKKHFVSKKADIILVFPLDFNQKL